MTYECHTTHGTMNVTVPDTWKVTFGPLFPGQKGGYGSELHGVLRFYEGTKQRGVLRDVNYFMDKRIGITIETGPLKVPLIPEKPDPFDELEKLNKRAMQKAKGNLKAQMIMAKHDPNADPTEDPHF